LAWKTKKSEQAEIKIVTPQPLPMKEEPQRLWKVGVIATETAPVIVNSETGQQLDLYSAIALLVYPE